MVKITHTNIIVDQFSSARNNPFNRYVHFLSHIHTDHLKGLSNSWDYGPIYCSPITKQLILLKFPKLNCLKQLELDKQHTIPLSSQLQVTVTMFDSNHCAGGVMILLEGFMGTVFYSGDMRFDRNIYSQYTYLYPHIRRNKEFRNCSIPIDFLYLDTTFLHPKFNFPSKTQALNQLERFIQSTIEKAKQKNQFIEFYIGVDSFGKQEILVNLAQKFHTLITVSQDRYKNISVIGLDSDCFTTDPDAGFIHVIVKRDMKEYLKHKSNSVGIILTGWANKAHYRNPRLYAIPYSLHSSYPELVAFVDSLRPSYIESILQTRPTLKGIRESQESVSFFQNSNSNENLYEEVDTSEYLNKLRNEYTSQPSEELKCLMTDMDFQKKIRQKLKLDRSSAQINKQEFGMTTTIVRVENINRAGARLTSERNEQEIEKLKQKLNKKKEQVKSKLFNGTNSIKIINKRIKYNGLTNLQNNHHHSHELNQDNNNQDQSIVQIDESSQQVNQNEQKSQQKSSNQKINSSNSRQSSKQNIQSYIHHQQIFLNNNKIQQSKENQLQEDPQTTRRNKWKKKVDSGEIDLFGPAITPSQKPPITKPATFTTRNSNPSIRIIKPKNISPQNSVIQILDQEQDQKGSQQNNSDSTTRRTREKKIPNQNSQTRVFNITNDNIVIDMPVERQPDQRTITEFFRKSQKQSNEKNLQPQQATNEVEKNTSNNLKNICEQTSQMQANNQNHKSKPHQQEYQQQKGVIPLRHCSEISLLQLNIQRLNSIKQASLDAYKTFFFTNHH